MQLNPGPVKSKLDELFAGKYNKICDVTIDNRINRGARTLKVYETAPQEKFSREPKICPKSNHGNNKNGR